MSLTIAQSKTAVGAGLTASFLGAGGVPPYAYSVLSGGAGGTVNFTSGVYTAPAIVNPDPAKSFDLVQVRDANNDTARAPILVASPLGLVCEIIQREMGLPEGRVYFWDQKINQPTDSDLYVAVSVLREKPFANNVRVDGSGSGLQEIQSLNVMAQLSVDVISRGPAARDRKEEILLALNSLYSQAQQEANSFTIGRIPPGGSFVNLSNVDGAAIPYRFNIAVNIQYFVKKVKAVPYFDDFVKEELVIDP